MLKKDLNVKKPCNKLNCRAFFNSITAVELLTPAFFLMHKWIPEIGWRQKCFFNSSGRYPA